MRTASSIVGNIQIVDKQKYALQAILQNQTNELGNQSAVIIATRRYIQLHIGYGGRVDVFQLQISIIKALYTSKYLSYFNLCFILKFQTNNEIIVWPNHAKAPSTFCFLFHPDKNQIISIILLEMAL